MHLEFHLPDIVYLWHFLWSVLVILGFSAVVGFVVLGSTDKGHH